MSKLKQLFGLLTIMAFMLVMSGTAMAAVNLDAASNPVKFANEIAVGGVNGTTLTNADNNLNVKAKWGFGASANATRYVRFDLSNDAEFAANPAYIVDDKHGVRSAGGNGESFVIFQVTATGSATDNDDVGTLTVNTGINVHNKNAVTMTYNQYETAGDAVNKERAIATASNNYIAWANALKATVDEQEPRKIDVAAESKKFVGDADVTTIANVDLAVEDGVNWTRGEQALITNIITAGSLVISGNFSAAEHVRDDLLNNFTLNEAKDTATFDFGATAYGPRTVNYTVTGDDVIAKTTFTGKFELTAAAGAEVSDINLGTLSVLDKNGTTKVVMNIPRPDGVDQAFIRITNTSGMSGQVFGRLFAQDGELLWSGTLADDLAAHATMAIGPNDWEVITGLTTWTGRSRLVVEGEISEMEVMGLIRTGGVLTNMSPTAPDGFE